MRLLAMLLLCSLANACGQATDESTSETESVVQNAKRWTNPSAIPVCIMNRDKVSDEIFEDIKDHVRSEFSKKTGINFVGWGSCTESQRYAKVIRVAFANKHKWSTSGAMTAGGGLSMVGMTAANCGSDCVGGTMRLDIGKSGDYPASSSFNRKFAVSRTLGTAVHEFGHAIGLLHEHERADASDCDRSDGSVINESSKNVFVTDYDANSIMNYCHSGDQTTLSKKDVQGVAFLYPSVAIGH